jgi:hypothetical protein
MGVGRGGDGSFTGRSKRGGGEILHIIKMALSNPDFVPFLHRARSN